VFDPDGSVTADTEAKLRQILDELDRRIVDVHERLSEGRYRQYVEKRILAEVAEAQREESRLLRYPGLAETVRDWSRRSVDDPDLRRMLELWDRRLTLSQVSALPEISELQRELANTFVEHTYTIDGRAVSLGDIRNILRHEPDRQRRRHAWRALGPLHDKLARGLTRLVLLRNRAAQSLGRETYVDLTLEIAGSGRREVEGLLERLTADTDHQYHKLLQASAAAAGLEDIAPWDIHFLLERHGRVDPDLFPRDRIIDTLFRWAGDHGLDLEELGIGVTFADIPYNGLSMPIRRGDTRILANPANGLSYYQTMFHELGHALHATFVEPEPSIYRFEGGPFTEAMAEVFGYVTNDPAWLGWFGLRPADAARVRQALLGPWYHYLRQRTAFALFEYRLYDDPDGDPDRLLAETETRVLGCGVDASPRWAANAWYVNFPVYWQNYVLADMIASQIHAGLEQRFGGLHDHRDALDHVRTVYQAPGSSIDWREKLRHDTGDDLKVAALVADLASLG